MGKVFHKLLEDLFCMNTILGEACALASWVLKEEVNLILGLDENNRTIQLSENVFISSFKNWKFVEEFWCKFHKTGKATIQDGWVQMQLCSMVTHFST